MKNCQKAELLRKFRPKSLYSITEKKEPNKVEFMEFNNYKPLHLLDPPADLMLDCNSSTKISKSSQFLIQKEENFSKFPIDYNYIEKHVKISRSLEFVGIEKRKNERCWVPKKFKPKQLFLDIDETLCYTYYHISKKNKRDVMLEGDTIISTRPWACQFIKRISEHYDIYSSADLEHVDDCLDLIDPLREHIRWVLSRRDCINLNGVMVKIINGMIGTESKSYVLVDDNAVNVIANPRNSILLTPYLGDQLDRRLIEVEKFLTAKAYCKDIREEIAEIFDINDILRL